MRLFAMLLLAAVSADAQSFEVASIKPSGPNSQRGSEGGPGSKDPLNYRFLSATLLDLIAIGHDVEYSQVSSKTALDSARFDVQAKLPPGATKDEFRAMMRNLLADRFHLKSHTETKDLPGFELVVAKNGPKLGKQPPRAAEGFPPMLPDRPGLAANFSMSGGYSLIRVRAQQQSMDALALALRRFSADEPNAFVVNHTGLAGVHDFLLEFTRENRRAPGADPPEPPVAPSLFTALQEQLGLQLVARKLPIPLIVVDSFDKAPTDN